MNLRLRSTTAPSLLSLPSEAFLPTPNRRWSSHITESFSFQACQHPFFLLVPFPPTIEPTFCCVAWPKVKCALPVSFQPKPAGMLDHVSIFTTRGVVLWSRSWAQLKAVKGEDPVSSLVRGVLLEGKAAAARTVNLDSYTLKWTLANDVGLVVVVVYQRVVAAP